MIDFHCYSDLRSEAKKLGYKDLGIIGAEKGLKGEEIFPKNLKQLKDKIRGSSADYTVVLSADPKFSRKCQADILSIDLEKPVFDEVIAASVDFIEIDLKPIIFSERRIKPIRNLSKIMLLARKYKNKILVTTKPRDETGLRSPKDLKSLLLVLGFNEHEVKEIIYRNPELLLKKIAKRKDLRHIAEGVEIES